VSGAIFIDRFSAGLDDLTRAQQADPIAVLKILHRTGKFSCFEASENMVIARMVTRLIHKALILKDSKGVKTEFGQLLTVTGGEYPWTTVKLTPGGLKLIGEPQDKGQS